MKKILLAAMGNCVHAAGIYNFSKLAKQENYIVTYLGSSNPIDKIINSIIESNPDIVAISYRLSSDSMKLLLDELIEKITIHNLQNKTFIFGGTVETAKIAESSGFFQKIFNGTEQNEDTVMFLRMQKKSQDKVVYPNTLIERINFKKPYPLIRHHLGLDTISKTMDIISKLADTKLIDIISIAPDQNCQEFYFNQKKMDQKQNGAGGTPIRSEIDLEKLYNSAQTGNFPLLRCYAGTNDILPFSKILKKTLNNAWAAIPLLWYSDLDRRSKRDLKTAIAENQDAIRWNAQNGIPVEINESHQWSLRYCSDVMEVVMSYIVAYNAKHLGVKNYIVQFMLSNPPGISPQMDLAKMQAKIEMITNFEDDTFNVIRMIRTGLLAFPVDEDYAKGLMASTMFYGALLKPDIVHVVSYKEAIERASFKDIVESIKITKKSIELSMQGVVDFENDIVIRARIDELKKEAFVVIDTIIKLGKDINEPLTSPEVLFNSVKLGILDAPGLKGFSVALGKFNTEIFDGKHLSIDEKGVPMTEVERLKKLGFNF